MFYFLFYFMFYFCLSLRYEYGSDKNETFLIEEYFNLE